MGVAEKGAEAAASYVSMEAEIPEVLYRGMRISSASIPIGINTA